MEAMQAALADGLLATDLADYLVRQGRIPVLQRFDRFIDGFLCQSAHLQNIFIQFF